MRDVLSSARRRDRINAEGGWVDGEPTRHVVKAFKTLADNIVESLSKGDRVFVHGTVTTETRTDKDTGGKRTAKRVLAEALRATGSGSHCRLVAPAPANWWFARSSLWQSRGMGEQVVGASSGHNALQLAQMVVSAGEVCAEALAPFTERDWRSVRAHELDWSVWDTIVHVNDDLYFYAAQILLADEGDYICFELAADDHATPERLLAALAVQTRLLAAAVAVADPGSRAHHVYGASDATGFAAMGAVETLVHTYDAVHGLDSSSTWRPPDDLAIPVLDRLFPHTPSGVASPPGELLLHMCGRIPLGPRARLTDWRWYGALPAAGPTNAP